MHKKNLVWLIAIALSVLAGLTFHQANVVSAQSEAPVGMVVAYTPGVSITIIDQKGNQTEYALDAMVKIEPLDAEKSLKVGSIVTIIAPASLDNGKQLAVGIVVHPEKDLLPSATPLIKNTPLPTEIAATSTPKVSETPTPAEIFTATPVGTLTVTVSPEPATGGKEVEATVQSNQFIEWLRSLFRQVLGAG